MLCCPLRVFALVACLGLWACSEELPACTGNEDCPLGSFCFPAGGELGVCTLGMWAENADTQDWAIVPLIQPLYTGCPEPSSSGDIALCLPEKDTQTNTQILTTREKKTQLTLQVFGATSASVIAEPGVSAVCTQLNSPPRHTYLSCELAFTGLNSPGTLHVSADNGRAKNILTLRWFPSAP